MLVTIRSLVMGLLVFVFALIPRAMLAGEERWRPVFMDKRNTMYFVDMKTASYPSPTTARVWVKRVYARKCFDILDEASNVKPEEDDLGYSLELLEVDCSILAFRRSKLIDYSRNGRLRDIDSRNRGWQDIVPETPAEAIMDVVCIKK